MDHQIAKQWTARLRSGITTQTRKHLGRNDGSRCCLGVLCDMAVEAGVISAPVKFRAGTKNRGCLVFAGSRHNLPPAVVNWAGLRTTYGQYPGEIRKGRAATNDANPSLALDNDGGATFTELASTIEEFADAL